MASQINIMASQINIMTDVGTLLKLPAKVSKELVDKAISTVSAFTSKTVKKA